MKYLKSKYLLLAIVCFLLTLASFIAVADSSSAFQHKKKKIVIFYSSIGAGHISAARSIEQEIKKESPHTKIVLKNIRDFMNPAWRKIDEKLYWFVVQNMPDTFDKAFQSLQERGNRVPSLTKLSNDYPEEKVLAYLKEQNADSIIATHYGSAQVLGSLKEHGELKDTKVGWVHTDYFTGYFPRVSKRIDKTFLAHPALEQKWIEAGVKQESVITTGMPVSVKNTETVDDKLFLEANGLRKDVPTFTIASGKDGVGDFAEAIRSIDRSFDTPVQVIAVTGTNNKNYDSLLKLMNGKTLKRTTIKLERLVPQPELISYIKASDAFITKAGGLSPAESFTIGKPTVLMTVIGGHEKENAALFDRLGLAVVNNDIKNIGKQVKGLLGNSEQQAKMLEEQRKFREKLDVRKIAHFALDDVPAKKVPENFGKENGVAAKDTVRALAQLEKDAPADIEILLSYSTSTKNERVVVENPFGHVAIRVENTVYSTNHVAQKETDPNYLQDLNLNDYLYGVERPTPSQAHTNSYGMAYGRDTIGLRIKGVPPDALKKMHEEAAKIDKEFLSGACVYDAKKSNCGDIVGRILEAAGYDVPSMPGPPKAPYTMPLDIFDKIKNHFTEDPRYRTELVSYNMLPGSKAEYRYSRFPLSITQPLRSVANVRMKNSDPLEKAVTKRVLGYAIDDSVHYENINGKSVANLMSNIQAHEAEFNRREFILTAERKGLEHKKMSLAAADGAKLYNELEHKEQQYIIERNYDLARITTEHLEDFLPAKRFQKIKIQFSLLMENYAALKANSSSELMQKFYSSLQNYEKSITQAMQDSTLQEHKILIVIRDYIRGLWEHLVKNFEKSSKYLAKISEKIPLTKGQVRKSAASSTNENCRILFLDLLRNTL